LKSTCNSNDLTQLPEPVDQGVLVGGLRARNHLQFGNDLVEFGFRQLPELRALDRDSILCEDSAFLGDVFRCEDICQKVKDSHLGGRVRE
jgi:hypothetical protein